MLCFVFRVFMNELNLDVGSAPVFLLLFSLHFGSLVLWFCLVLFGSPSGLLSASLGSVEWSRVFPAAWVQPGRSSRGRTNRHSLCRASR